MSIGAPFAGASRQLTLGCITGHICVHRAFPVLTRDRLASGFACSAAAPEAISRMGFAESDLGAQSWLAMFRKALTKLGWLEGASSRSETMAGASKLTLDFLLRRATMMSRPGTELHIRREKPALATAIPSLHGRDRYDGRVHGLAAAQYNPGRRWYSRYGWKRCNRATKNSPCFAANSPPGRGEWNTNKSSSSQRIARGVACACVETRRRDRLKATPSPRKTGQMASAQTHRGRNA